MDYEFISIVVETLMVLSVVKNMIYIYISKICVCMLVEESTSVGSNTLFWRKHTSIGRNTSFENNVVF